MVTKFLPLPADNGGKRRSLAILRRLAERGEVVLCAFDDGRADHQGLARLGVELRAVPWRPTLVNAGRGLLRRRSVSAGRFFDPRLAAAVADAVAQPTDLLLVGYAQLAPYGRGLSARLRVVDLHNVESTLARRYGQLKGPILGLPYALEARALVQIERAAVQDNDVVLVVSEADRQRLPAGGNIVVCPNGWDPGEPLPPADEPVVAFVALLGWAPNADAACWLVAEVWPLVRQRCPGARLLLVGRDPTAKVSALATHDIEVTGAVPEVAPYLGRSRVALAPLRAGGGSRLKILEALDAGRPVVATTIGTEGLEDLIGDGVVVADDPEAMAEAITALLEDSATAAELGARGHAAVKARHSWDRTLAPLLDRIGA